MPEQLNRIEYTSDVRYVRIKNNMDDWSIPEKLRPFISAIYSAYAYDNNVHVHCCELTPSFECHFLGHVCDYAIDDVPDDIAEEIAEEIDNLMMEGDACVDCLVSYYHCYSFDPEKNPYNFDSYGVTTYNNEDHDGDTKEELMQCAIDNAIEYYRCNSVF